MSKMSDTDILVREYNQIRNKLGAAASADRLAIKRELRDLGWSHQEVVKMLATVPDETHGRGIMIELPDTHSPLYYATRNVVRAVLVVALGWACIVLAWGVMD